MKACFRIRWGQEDGLVCLDSQTCGVCMFVRWYADAHTTYVWIQSLALDTFLSLSTCVCVHACVRCVSVGMHMPQLECVSQRAALGVRPHLPLHLRRSLFFAVYCSPLQCAARYLALRLPGIFLPATPPHSGTDGVPDAMGPTCSV